MPTKYTGIISKILSMTLLRKNYLLKIADNTGIALEYVPVLEYIRHNPGCIQNDIAKKLRLTPSAITQSTKKLEGLGFIKKNFDSDNLRIKKLYITDKGIDMLKAGTDIFDDIDGIMFRSFSDDELDLFEKYIDRIRQNIISEDPEVKENHLPWEFTEKGNLNHEK